MRNKNFIHALFYQYSGGCDDLYVACLMGRTFRNQPKLIIDARILWGEFFEKNAKNKIKIENYLRLMINQLCGVWEGFAYVKTNGCYARSPHIFTQRNGNVHQLQCNRSFVIPFWFQFPPHPTIYVCTEKRTFALFYTRIDFLHSNRVAMIRGHF